MLTLLKRELKSLLLKPFTLTVFVLLFLVPAIVFSVFLSFGTEAAAEEGKIVYAGFENLISLSAVFMAIVIPAVVIYSVRCERKNKSLEYIISLPVSRISAMLSKLISLIAYFALPLCVMAIYPLVLSKYGKVNNLQAYLALLMLALFVSFIVCFSFMIATRITRPVIAGVVAYSALLVSYVLGLLSSLVRFLPLGTGFDRIAQGILSELSVFKKIDKAVIEVFDWTDLLFFAVGAVAFAMIASFMYGRSNKIKVKNKINVKRIGIACASLLLVACVGILPTFMPYSIKQIDISKNNLYTPDKSTADFISKLDEDVTIYLINPYGENKALHNAILRTAEKSKHIKLEVVNSMEDTDFLNKYGLPTDNGEDSLNALSYAMVIQSGKRWSFINQEDYYIFFVGEKHLTVSEFQQKYVTYASFISEYYPQMNQLNESQLQLLQLCIEMIQKLEQAEEHLKVESAIATSIEYVIADIIPKVYFLSGHGEEGTDINPYDFSKNYQIPRDANVLVINSPSSDYTADEVNTLIKYVDNGGKLYILTDKENYAMPNFSKLLKHYGFVIEDAVITDDNSAVVDISVNKDHPAFTSSNVIKMTDVSKITTEGSKYKYDTMLSYSETVGEGDNAQTSAFPVAMSASENGEKRVVLLTGAKTFNSNETGIENEALERSATILNSSISWLFDPFSSKLQAATPKAFQKIPYVTTTADVIKSVIIFDVAIPAAILFSAVIYILSRKLRSKKGKENNPEIY